MKASSQQSAWNERTPLSSSYVKANKAEVKYERLEVDFESEKDDLHHRKANLNIPLCVYFVIGLLCPVVVLVTLAVMSSSSWAPVPPQHTSGAWSSKAMPFSTVDPASLGLLPLSRPEQSAPGVAFVELMNLSIPLPTNSWYENFLLGERVDYPENKVFQVPYILDTAGPIPGIRSHPCHVQSNSRAVMMTYEYANGVTLGAMQINHKEQHFVRSQGKPAITKLAIEMQWNAHSTEHQMRTPIVRGAPYTSMIYENGALPRIYSERPLKKGLIFIDQLVEPVQCGIGRDTYSDSFRVERELKIELDQSDMTWLVFLSSPMEFRCASYDASEETRKLNLPPGVIMDVPSLFDLQAISSTSSRAMVRLAMSNNCTTGQNPQYCGPELKPRNQSEYETLLRKHADVYPTAKADIEFTFPVESQEEEELRLIFNWHPALMSSITDKNPPADVPSSSFIPDVPIGEGNTPELELLMFALPHHQERMKKTLFSSNNVHGAGCMPTIHGVACPAVGGSWSMIEHLHRTNFSASRPIREEMRSAVEEAAKEDLLFAMPRNYMVGAGDTYFSGKLLAKLGRTIVIAHELGFGTHEDPDVRHRFESALDHLQQGVEIWLNGSAESPFLYDASWRGLMMCGCEYTYSQETKEGHCANVLDRENTFHSCPALVDMGHNFGAGFYNDHHYHFGYHIYAAAVLGKFRWAWAKKYVEHVLLLIRDIANPSDDDKFFPTWRHKDWYLGFSWASGVVTIGQRPYPNGRNQESVSEAIAAYEAIALFGNALHDGYLQEIANLSVVVDQVKGTTTRLGGENKQLHSLMSELEDFRVKADNALRIQDMGRLLMATEIRSAKTYWHVQQPGTKDVARIYPDTYQPRIIGMIWSMLAQEQTWFGNEEWKSYGIQLLPITVASELRDDVSWMEEMLPFFQNSCEADPGCLSEGWSVLIYTSMATVGRWKEAWDGMTTLPDTVFDHAGANGHSRTNSLWYIATR